MPSPPAPPRFLATTVCRALGFPIGTLNRYLASGMLHYLDGAATEPRMARVLSFEDACSVALLRRLTDLGIAPLNADHLVQTAIDAVDLHPADFRVLVYREHDRPEGQTAEITFDDRPHEPGAILEVRVDLAVLFSRTADRLRGLELNPQTADATSHAG